MNLDEILTQVNDYELQLKELKSKYNSKIKSELFTIFQDYFKEDSETKAIVWIQFTPFFNDGSECIFEVHEPAFWSEAELIRKGVKDDLSQIEPDAEDLRLPYTWGKLEGKVYDHSILGNDKIRESTESELMRYKLAKLLTSETVAIVLKLTFGDHTMVVVTPDGIESFEY